VHAASAGAKSKAGQSESNYSPPGGKAKSVTAGNMYVDRFEYHPVGSVGIRFSQHFFPNEVDKNFIDGLPHLE